MAESPMQSDRPPIQQTLVVVDLLETPALARIYTHVLREGPVTVADVVDDLDIPQGTARILRPVPPPNRIEDTGENEQHRHDRQSELQLGEPEWCRRNNCAKANEH